MNSDGFSVWTISRRAAPAVTSYIPCASKNCVRECILCSGAINKRKYTTEMYKKWNTLRSIKNVWTGRTLLSIHIRVNLCPLYRFSAFWLRSKCSICSYQLNIWYEDHVSSSILNGFLQGMERQELAPVPWRVGLALQYCKDRLTPLTTESLANQHQMVISTYIRQWARIILAICNDQVRICHHFYMRQF